MMVALLSKTQVLMLLLLQVFVLVSAKPIEKVQEQMQDAKDVGTQLYELQMTVWPTDIDDIVDAVADSQDPSGTFIPIVEEPIVVMPALDDEYDDVNELDDEMDLSPTPGGADDQFEVKVLENYHISFANGTEEYKLTLSNGLVNFQRIDLKNINGKMRPVHEGYYTVPSGSMPASYQTVYYHADENGYNVYKTEQSPRNPAYDYYLQYTKEQDEISQ